MARKMLTLLMAFALIRSTLTGFAGIAEAVPDTFATTLEAKYTDPDRIYSSDVRWWLGDASNTDEALLDEIQALYDGGFRGVELCMQDDEVAPNEV